MEIGLLSILSLGLILGIKHAIEPDHIIAVSTIASRSKKLWRSSLSGIFWGIGHTATLFVVGVIVILLKGEISDVWAMSLEFLVGIMLVYLGITSFFSLKNARKQESKYNEKKQKHSHIAIDISYIKSMAIGSVHGLAGSAAMILLIMSTVNNVWESAFFILIFGVGTIIGMLFFTTILGIPFVFKSKKLNINKTLIRATGTVSTVFGIYYMYNLGITEGLFKLLIQ